MKNLIKDLESLNRHDTLDATDHELIAKVIEVLKAQDSVPAKRDNKSFHDSIEAAAKLLCDNTAELGDDNIHEQVKRIAAHPNQSDLIDNVEGVIVWEKVVWSFTCEEFLEYIDWN